MSAGETIERKIIVKKEGKETAEETVTTVNGEIVKIETAEERLAREEEERLNLIKEVAEEVHPGCWDYGPMEPALARSYGRTHYPPEGCDCDYCNYRGTATECSNPVSKRFNRLLIHFPTAIIKNSNDHEHPIKDFYIAIAFESDHKRLMSTSLRSIRTTVTSKEYACGFVHSHSQGRDYNCNLTDYFSWRGCCLGGDTSLTDILYDLYDPTKGITKSALFELLVTLYIYASWESLSGGPYYESRHLSYPKHGSSGSIPSIPVEFLLEQYEYHIFSNPDILPELIGGLNDLAISNVEKSITPFLTKVLKEEYRDQYGVERLDFFIGTKDVNGTFTPLRSVATPILRKNRDWYIEKIEQAKTLRTRQIINLGAEKDTKFIIEIDEEGLSTDAPISEKERSDAEIHPQVVKTVTSFFLKKFKKFKLEFKIHQRYGEN